jgi:hypothetical protein
MGPSLTFDNDSCFKGEAPRLCGKQSSHWPEMETYCNYNWNKFVPKLSTVLNKQKQISNSYL